MRCLCSEGCRFNSLATVAPNVQPPHQGQCIDADWSERVKQQQYNECGGCHRDGCVVG